MTNNLFAQVGYSTFTHIGRHSRTIRTVIKMLDREPKIILDLGSGVLEPFLIAEHLAFLFPNPQTIIKAYDTEKPFIELIANLKNGESVPFEILASIACDRDLFGHPIVNDNFKERAYLGIRDYEESGLDSGRIIDMEKKELRLNGVPHDLVVAEQVTVDLSFFSKLLTKDADIIYCGALFINILKLKNRSYLKTIIYRLNSLLRFDGLLAIGTSPSFMYGASPEMYLLSDAGFIPLTIWIENVIYEPGKGIFGDYSIVLSNDTRFLIKSENDAIITQHIANDPVISKMPIVNVKMSYVKLVEHFSYSQGMFCLCAIKSIDDSFRVWLINQKYLISEPVFRERFLFNLFRL
jgi:hypothetical protein